MKPHIFQIGTCYQKKCYFSNTPEIYYIISILFDFYSRNGTTWIPTNYHEDQPRQTYQKVRESFKNSFKPILLHKTPTTTVWPMLESIREDLK